MRNTVVCILGFTAIWVLLSQSFSWQVWLAGAVVASLLAFSYSSARYAKLCRIAVSPNTFRALGGYAVLFLKELLKANFQVALLVVNPTLPIHPGIVKVKTSLKSPIGRLMLANSITLTPGTLTVEIEDDALFIHWVNVSSPDIEAATHEIVQKFEKHLEVLYG